MSKISTRKKLKIIAQKGQIFSDSVQVSSNEYLRLVSYTSKKLWHKSVKYFQMVCKCQISQVDQPKRVAIEIWRDSSGSSLQRS